MTLECKSQAGEGISQVKVQGTRFQRETTKSVWLKNRMGRKEWLQGHDKEAGTGWNVQGVVELGRNGEFSISAESNQ